MRHLLSLALLAASLSFAVASPAAADWREPAPGPIGSSPAVAAGDEPWIAWADGGAVRVATLAASGWSETAPLPDGQPSVPARAPRLAVDGATPYAVWQEGTGIY